MESSSQIGMVLEGQDHQVPPLRARIVRSALWAASGDACGFPYELAPSLKAAEERFDRSADGGPTIWLRRVGGRTGPTVRLPVAAYSDDTQLRLAVGRCMRSGGRFDIEAFSKIELPVFLAYALGAGRGTKAAARNLQKRNVRWSSNFFSEKAADYINGGGNGAAMRIQPHVWAARGADVSTIQREVFRDSVCTHGHPRGLLGALHHARALIHVIHGDGLPSPDKWHELIPTQVEVQQIVSEDEDLRTRWLPLWETSAKSDFGEAVGDVIKELKALTSAAAKSASKSGGDPIQRYQETLKDEGGFDPKTRGSGTISSVFSLWVAWTWRESAWEGIQACAKAVGSDTDTIATLAGALLGPAANDPPALSPLDSPMIRREAERLHAIGLAEEVGNFPHPDPLRWKPPRKMTDAVGLLEDSLAIAGLGPATPSDMVYDDPNNESVIWQWIRTSYGQGMLVKRLRGLDEIPDFAKPRFRAQVVDSDSTLQNRENQSRAKGDELPEDPEQAFAMVARRNFEPVLMAKLLRHLSLQPHGVTRASVFAGFVARELQTRKRQERDGGTKPRQLGSHRKP